MRDLVCGVDAGTTRIRAMLFDTANGTVVAEGSRPTPTTVLAPGIAQHDADALWQAAAESLRDATAKLDDGDRVRGVTVASFGEAGVLMDADGRPLGPTLAWYDTRTAGMLQALLDRIGADALTRTTGLCPDPTFALLKLLWLEQTLGESFAQARRWLHVGEYLAHRLGAESTGDLSLASRTMALDLRAGRWADDLLAEAGIPRTLLAPLAASGTAIGRIGPDVAAYTGLPEGCVIGLGGHDHICGALAVAADSPGVMMDSMGTAEAITLILDRPRCDPALGALGFNEGAILADRRLSYVFGGLPTSAACVEWFRNGPAAGADYATLIDEASAAPAGADGVLFLPQLRIGSPPHPDPVARGAFLGLSTEASRGVMFRALLEGMAIDAANVLATLLDAVQLARPERIVGIGGSTRNPLLMRLKAAAFGRPIEISSIADTTCLGAAMLAAKAAGVFASLDEARRVMAPARKPIAADGELSAQYDRLRREVYAPAYATMREVTRRIVAARRVS